MKKILIVFALASFFLTACGKSQPQPGIDFKLPTSAPNLGGMDPSGVPNSN